MIGATYSSFNEPIKVTNDLPTPRPSSDGVVVKIMATGVCRSDWHGWRGHDDDIRHYLEKHGDSFVPGHEASGVVVEVGSEVTRIKVGDRVAIPFILSCGNCRECDRKRPTVCEDQNQPGFTMLGTFAEYCALTRADRNLKIIPEGVSFVEAAALGCRFTTAYRAVIQQGQLCEGEDEPSHKKTVAVFGCGGLGLSCVAIASAFGAKRIIAVDVSNNALLKAKELGAIDTVLSTLSTDTEDYDSQNGSVFRNIMALTDGVGADLTIDAGGFKQTCLDSVFCCRRGGRMVQVGLPANPPILPMARVAGREITIIGSHGFSSVNDDREVSALDHILDLVKQGKLQPNLLVDREVSLKEGVQELMNMNKSSPIGMVMITTFRDSISKM
jgi:alcohol dehydrogenase